MERGTQSDKVNWKLRGESTWIYQIGDPSPSNVIFDDYLMFKVRAVKQVALL